MSAQPILIDVKGAFDGNQDNELRRRHARYGQYLKSLSGGSIDELVVLSRSRRPPGALIEKRNGLMVLSLGSNRDPWTLGRTSAKLMESVQGEIVWIAGTPFVEAIACISANANREGRVQIQAHGDFGRLTPRSGSLTNRFRWFLANRTFQRCDSLRAVSSLQLHQIQSAFSVPDFKCFIAPVPINQDFLTTSYSAKYNSDQSSIGFFGRIHQERGLDLWADTARQIRTVNPNALFHVIGDGPHRRRFLDRLGSFVPPQNIHFHGNLEDSVLTSTIASLSVVFNSCSLETYGRATLECLAIGTPVVAVKSSGSCEIAATFQTPLLRVVESRDATRALLEPFDYFPKEIVHNVRQQVTELEHIAITSLVTSWL